MALTILEDVPTSQLVRVRDEHGFEFYTMRRRLQHVRGEEYALLSVERAKTLRAQYARKQKSGELAMTGPSRNLRTSTSGGR